MPSLRRRRPPRPGALADLAPLRILTQICLLQLSYYGAAIVLIVFTTIVAGQHMDPGMIFDWRHVRGDVTTGWTLGLCWMLDSLVTVIPILLLIARSKLVPDFAITIHFINLLITSFYTHAIPSTFSWWVLQILSTGLMISLGMWACQWRELRPMIFGAGARAKEGIAENGHAPGPEEQGEGYEMGIGGGRAGRGRDGGGAYEMVNMERSKEDG